MNKTIFVTVILLAIGGLSVLIARRQPAPQSFSECLEQGNPIMESYPRQCRANNGELFVELIESATVTMSGEVICLPHKDTSGPQTLECAFGLQDESGNAYALSDPTMQFIPSLPTGQQISVTGQLNTTPRPNEKYAIVGVVEIHSIVSE